MTLENSIETYALPYVKSITSVSLMYEAGHPKLVFCDNLKGQAVEGVGRGIQDGEDTCIPMVDSYCYMTNIVTIL